MKFERLHRKAAFICASLLPIGFLIGGINELPNQTGRATCYFFFLGSVYMQFYYLYRIEKGSIKLLITSHVLDRVEEPLGFWPYVGAMMLGFAFIALISIVRGFT